MARAGSPFSGRVGCKISFQVHYLHLQKPTFIGQYLRWNSFSPQKSKINLILTSSNRTFAICFRETLPSELDKIKLILQTDGYPEHVIKSFLAEKMKQFHAMPKIGPGKCPVFLRLPWLDSVSP